MNNIISQIAGAFAASTYFGVCISIGSFVMISFLTSKIKNPWIKPWINPLLITIILLIGGMVLLKIPYEAYKPSGDVIGWFLTPATVSLAVPLYQQLQILRNNKLAIISGVFTGSIASVISIFLMCKLMNLPLEIHTSLSPKSVTTAIATGITGELGGIIACTVAAVVLTGIFGAAFAIPLKKIFRIKSDVAWGVACGTSSHAVGTATILQVNKVAGAMSSISIIVAGIFSVILVPVMVSFY